MTTHQHRTGRHDDSLPWKMAWETFARPPPHKRIAGVDICPLFIFTKLSFKNLYFGQSSLYKNTFSSW